LRRSVARLASSRRWALRRSGRARMRGERTSLKDPGLWYAVRSRISDMGFLCVGESGGRVSRGKPMRFGSRRSAQRLRRRGVAFRDRARARTCAKTCIAESLILLTAPMRGEPVAVTSAMTAGMGDGEVSVGERLGAERRMRRRQSRKKMSTRRDCPRLRRRRTRRREPMRAHGGGINAARASGTRASHSRTRSARRRRRAAEDHTRRLGEP